MEKTRRFSFQIPPTERQQFALFSLALRSRLGWFWPVMVFIAALIAVVIRRPDAILNPQFYAEDGVVWFAGAYNHGWLKSMFVPEGGYLLLIPRIAAGLALLVPFHLAPLVLNSIGLIVQVLPACFLLLARCANWGTLPFRACLAISYLLLPNAVEIQVTVTNAEWHAAVLLFLVIVTPARTRGDRFFDIACICLVGLTGPFSLILLPIAAFVCYRDRSFWNKTRLFLIICCAATQAAYLVFGMHVRDNPLGASLSRFLDMVGGNVFLGSVFGYNSMAQAGPHYVNVMAAIAGVALMGLFVHSVRKRELTLFVIFSLLILGASLYKPLVPGSPAWDVLRATPGGRYWFFPTLAMIWSTLSCLRWAAHPSPRVLAMLVAFCMLFGYALDFRLPPFHDTGFREQAMQFEQAAPGTQIRIGLLPRPTTLFLMLRKH